MKTNDGGPAFPGERRTISEDGTTLVTPTEGMSLRDWFAAQDTLEDWDSGVSMQMAVALAGRERPTRQNSTTDWQHELDKLAWEADWRSAFKYIRADAMLKARES